MRFAVLSIYLFLSSCAAIPLDYSRIPQEQLPKEVQIRLETLEQEAFPVDRSPDFEKILTAQTELVKMGERIIPLIRETALNADNNLKLLLITILGEIGTDDAIQLLREIYAGRAATVIRDAAAIALGMNGDEWVIERLIEIADRERHAVRRAFAVHALSNFKGNDKVSIFLLHLLDDKTPIVVSQEVLSGFFPFRRVRWGLEEMELRDFAIASLGSINNMDFGYRHGDGEKAKSRAIDKWKEFLTEKERGEIQ